MKKLCFVPFSVVITVVLSGCLSYGRDPYSIAVHQQQREILDEISSVEDAIESQLSVSDVTGLRNGFAVHQKIAGTGTALFTGHTGRPTFVERRLHVNDETFYLRFRPHRLTAESAEVAHLPNTRQRERMANSVNDMYYTESTSPTGAYLLEYQSLYTYPAIESAPRPNYDVDRTAILGRIVEVGTDFGHFTHAGGRAELTGFAHPGIIQFPDLDLEEVATFSLSADVEELAIDVFRFERQPIFENGYPMGERRVVEGYVSGEHNVYLAFATEPTGTRVIDGRRVAQNQGFVSIVILVYESEAALRSALADATDSRGFNIWTGLNAAGFREDGSSVHGYSFDGRVGRTGRQGLGTTRLDDGTSITTTYSDDSVTERPGRIELPDGTQLYGYISGDTVDGVFVELAASDAIAYISTFESGTLVSRTSIDDPFLRTGWVSLAGAAAGQADAVSLDGTAALTQLPDGTVRIESATGAVYTGEFPVTDRPVFAEITYPDGGRYVGQTVNGQPDGDGILQRADGVELEGTFSNGVPDGEMIERGNGAPTLVRFSRGEIVREGNGRQEDYQATVTNYIQEATEAWFSRIRQNNAEEAAAARARREAEEARRREIRNALLGAAIATVEVMAETAQAMEIGRAHV